MRVSLLLFILLLSPNILSAQDSESVPLRLIWFGGTGGASSHVSAHSGTQIAASRGVYTPVWSGPRAFVSDSHILFSETGLTVESFRRLLADPNRTTRVIDSRAALFSSPFELIYFGQDTPPEVRHSLIQPDNPDSPFTKHEGPLSQVTFTDGDALLLERTPNSKLPADPSLWEVRFAQKGHFNGHPMFLIGRPLNEGSRRTKRVEELLSEAPGETITLSAGENFETQSYLAGDQPDLQRPNTWASMARMSVDAIIPGRDELAFGVAALSKEAKAAQIPILASNYSSLTRPGWWMRTVQGVHLLIIGLVDQSVDGASDPVHGIENATAAATKQLGRRPDLIIAVGHLSAASRARVAAESRHLDLLLGNFDRRGVHPEAINQTSSGDKTRVERAYDRHPLTVVEPGDARLGYLDLNFRRREGQAGYVLSALSSHAVPVLAQTQKTAVLSRRIQAVRHEAFAKMQRPLLPDLGPSIDANPKLRAVFNSDVEVTRQIRQGAKVPAYMTEILWRQLCARVLAQVTESDIAVLPDFAVNWNFKGPTTVLRAVANLGVPGELSIVEMTGAQLTTALPILTAFKGTIIGLDKGRVHGHKIDPRESYRIALSAHLARQPSLAAIITKRWDTFSYRGDTLAIDSAGKPQLIRQVMVNGLAALGQRKSEIIAVEMRPNDPEPHARWMLDVKQISLGATQYQNAGKTASYGQVKETRVTTSDNRSVSYRGGLSLAREGAAVTWITSGEFAYDKAYYEESDDQETADELKFSTELRVPAWSSLSLGSVPFAGVGYSTEFTPTEGESGENPRKKLLEGTVGLVWATPWLKSAKLAAIIARDLSATITDPQYGLLLSVDMQRSLPIGRWFLTTEGRYFLPGVGQDDASELGLTIASRTGLDLPLWERLSVGVFVDAFTYRGQVAETNDIATSFMSGFALKYDHRIRLDRRGL